MIPIQFGRSCGWYHASSSVDKVVIICGSIGFEALALHRPMRIFADSLANRGFGVLRFDYPGVGDAAGEDSEPNLLDAWLSTITLAVDWIRSKIDPTEIVLCGIHFGALLATLAAVHIGDFTRLVLMAPVTSGYKYIRSQKLSAKLSLGLPGIMVNNYLDLKAQRLHASTIEAISNVDLLLLKKAPASEVLIMTPEGISLDAFQRRLCDLDANVTQAKFINFRDLMREAHVNETPQTTFEQVSSWLKGSSHSPALKQTPVPDSGLVLETCLERRVQFLSAEGHHLVGVICEPLGRAPTSRLIIVNTGGEPHYGSTRFAVMLSRLMAFHDVATLRFDLAGLGDSRKAGDDHRPHAYSNHTSDILAAIDWMQAPNGSPLCLFGVCSGAYQAMMASVVDPRVDSLILINQEVFDWSHSKVVLALRGYGRLLASRLSAFRRRKAKVVSSTSIDNLGRRDWLRRSSRALVRFDAFLDRTSGRGSVARFLRVSATRRTRVMFLTGADEFSSLDLLTAYFGVAGKRLRHLRTIQFKVVAGLDHGLNSHNACEALFPIVENFLLEKRRR